MILSLLIFVSSLEVTNAANLSEILGPVAVRSFDIEMKGQERESKGTFLAIVHDYSAYDRAQLNGQLSDTNAVSGILTVDDVKVAVTGTRQGKFLSLRKLSPSIITSEQQRSENIQRWVSQNATSNSLTATIISETPSTHRLQRFAGYMKEGGQWTVVEFAGFETSSLSIGMMAIAWPYRARFHFADSKGPKTSLSIEEFWKLGRVLSEHNVAALDTELQKLSTDDWKQISTEAFGQLLNLDLVLKEAKVLSSTPVINEAGEVVESKFKEGSLSDAVGCHAAQIAFVPVIGQQSASESLWLGIDYHPTEANIFRYRHFRFPLGFEALKDFEAVMNFEQIQPNAPAYQAEAKIFLKAVKD